MADYLEFQVVAQDHQGLYSLATYFDLDQDGVLADLRETDVGKLMDLAQERADALDESVGRSRELLPEELADWCKSLVGKISTFNVDGRSVKGRIIEIESDTKTMVVELVGIGRATMQIKEDQLPRKERLLI